MWKGLFPWKIYNGLHTISYYDICIGIIVDQICIDHGRITFPKCF